MLVKMVVVFYRRQPEVALVFSHLYMPECNANPPLGFFPYPRESMDL